MFKLEAPYPSVQTTIILPSPQWSDSIALTSSLKTMRAMDGSMYTYINKRNERKILHWTFLMSVDKMWELKAFIYAYFKNQIKIIDEQNNVRIGYLQNNPYEFLGAGRAKSIPGGEITEIALDFEEAN